MVCGPGPVLCEISRGAMGRLGVVGAQKVWSPRAVAAARSAGFCDLYYGLKEDYSGGDAAGEQWRSEHAK